MSRLYMKMLIAACLAACKCQVLIRCLWNYFQALQLMSSLQTEPLFWEIYIYVCARNCSSYTVKINEPGFKTSRLTWVSWGNLKQVAKLQNFADFFFFWWWFWVFFFFKTLFSSCQTPAWAVCPSCGSWMCVPWCAPSPAHTTGCSLPPAISVPSSHRFHSLRNIPIFLTSNRGVFHGSLASPSLRSARGFQPPC